MHKLPANEGIIAKIKAIPPVIPALINIERISFFLSVLESRASFKANKAISVIPNPVATKVIETVRNLLYIGT